MIDSKTRLNGIINSLSSQISNVKFTQYCPNIQLQLPLKGSFVASVGVKSEEKTSRKQKIVYRITLLAGIDTNGISMLEKANQIVDVLLNYNTSELSINTNSQCVVGDLEYLPSDRCLRIYIDYTLQCDDGDANISTTINGREISGVLISQQSSTNNIDIKVYGESKPYDTLFGETKYVIKFRLTESLYNTAFNLKYTNGKVIYNYNNCRIQQCNVYILDNKMWYEYQVVTTERVVE